jgi:hypothetical protein
MFRQNEGGFCRILRGARNLCGARLRDNHLCNRCGTIPRSRAVVEVLNTVAPEWRSGFVHECSRGADHNARKYPNYSYSYSYVEREPGAAPGMRQPVAWRWQQRSR